MCTKNRFLNGCLVYLYEYNLSAVIGHCCADDADIAEREYDRARTQQWEEDYLIEALPLVVAKLKVVASNRTVAEELQRIQETQA